ncbi:zinc finger and SCAN domain-containing protein 2 isoform X7 [Cephus cinctus]|uniref:Zinc finger and SCAN domain-containing protein 2 isoform X7 n=1 Tax=Cephus cinctus TaxID=211228 RepID=A0AAJ7BMI5_CEPCN|nr:zinc finger and SCAN domain-containing protein 2 isoform X7 [Cephus cinctus]
MAETARSGVNERRAPNDAGSSPAWVKQRTRPRARLASRTGVLHGKMSSLDYLDLCRLCLVKDRVSVPIFEGEGDVRQIFLKIAACLPVKVAREDKLPKKICDDCVYKVELFYQFWNTTANAEKQLLQWLGEVGLEEKQGYVTGVLNPSVMKQEQNSESRLDSNVMQQVSGHQDNMGGMTMIDNMGLGMPIMIPSGNQQQITSVPMDTSGNSVQTVRPVQQAVVAVAGPSAQPNHQEQLAQNQGSASATAGTGTNPTTATPTVVTASISHQDDEEDTTDEDENSDEECDADEGLPVKEESEEDPSNNRTIEPTTFVNVSLACDEAGPSGLQQQKITEMPEMSMPQAADGDPKSGEAELFGGLSGMLRQILSPSPESGELILAGYCNFIPLSPPTITTTTSTSTSTATATTTPFLHAMLPLALEIGHGGSRSLLSSLHSITETSNVPFDSSTSSISAGTITSNAPGNVAIGIATPIDHQVNVDHRRIIRESHVCPTCGLVFHTRFKLTYHLSTSHLDLERRFSCGICSKTFLTQSHLRMHEVTHIETTKPFGCDKCTATFRYRTLLERHKKVHDATRDKPYSCPRCPLRFETRNAYNHHTKTHKSTNNTFNSSSSSRSSSIDNKNSSNSSKDSSNKNKSDRINTTGVRTVATARSNIPSSSSKDVPSVSEQLTLRNVVETVAAVAVTVGNSSYPCDSCTKEFPTLDSLTSHKSIMHRSRPLVCDVCGKGFTHRKYYVVHQRIHTGERPYLCAMCGKSFTQASTLTVHRRYHTGERPYTCTLCGKGFVTRTIMLNHMKKH